MNTRSKQISEPDHTLEARLRALPSITDVLNTSAALELVQRFGRQISTEAVRASVDDARTAIKTGAPAPDADYVARQTLARLSEQDRSSLRPLFNLTGTILHTNLGRAVLAEIAIEAATAAMRNAVALEFDLSAGKRGERDDHVRALLCELTGAEDATVVNNNAAAVLLCLNTLAQGREAIVSRGELIEIGGAFRMPDIMARAGTRMVEVGTTNRTHARDYREALSEHTGVILKVHTSNYRIQGFTAEVGAAELAAIARENGVPLLNDLGSGTLIDLARFGVQKEPTVREAVAQGAGLVTFSGDKLLGGPQAGFIVGRSGIDRGDQSQSDEARTARRQDPARGDRSHAEIVSRSRSARRATADTAGAGAVQGRYRSPGSAPATRIGKTAWHILHGRLLRLREPDRIRRVAAGYHCQRRSRDPRERRREGAGPAGRRLARAETAR